MYAAFIVAALFARARGQTWLSSVGTATAIGWTATQVRKGALLRLATAGNTLMSMTLWNVTAGVALGVAGGIGTSQLLFGDEGRKDAIDLYTGKVSAGLYVDTVLKVPGRLEAITQGNRAVENNAAGLPTGTNTAAKQTGQGMEPDYTNPNWQSGWWQENPS